MNQFELLQLAGDKLPIAVERMSDTISSITNEMVVLESPLALSANVNEMMAELGGQVMCIKFAMASEPEQTQMLVAKTDAVLQLHSALTGQASLDVDDTVEASVRPLFESMIQGLCIGLTEVMQSTVVVSGLTIRYQELQLPEVLSHSSNHIRTHIALKIAKSNGETFSGVIYWIKTEATLRRICNIASEEISSRGSSEPATASTSESTIDALLDVPLEISVELGRVRMLVREVLELGTGSIVEVDKAAGEPVDVMVNGRLVAKGEVVVIEDNFGVRITEVLNPTDRLRIEAAA